MKEALEKERVDMIVMVIVRVEKADTTNLMGTLGHSVIMARGTGQGSDSSALLSLFRYNRLTPGAGGNGLWR